MKYLKLISHFTINQLHYQVHKPFVKVLFLSATLCLERFRFENEKKNLTKRERQVIVGLKFQTPDAPPPPDSLTPCLWTLLTIQKRFRQYVTNVTNITNFEPLDIMAVLLIVHCQRHQHQTS
jgi:hypothetical protein